jgi:hypothetical protein
LENIQRDEFDPFAGLTQNLTMKGVPGDEDIGIGFREIQDGGLCLREREWGASV